MVKIIDKLIMEAKVLAYIEYLRSEIKERPQCFMFALLLKCKFPGAILLYNSHHFITLIGAKRFDWDGVVEKKDGFLIFSDNWGDNHIVNHYNAIKDKFIETEYFNTHND